MLYFNLLLALGQVASALNLTYSGNCTSSNSSSIDIPFINATSTTNFTLKELTGNDDPWYYHLALVSPAHKDPTHQLIHSWLSIPESFLGTETANKTTLCAHFLDSQEASVKNMQGNNTCAGILSDKCIQGFENIAAPSSFDMCPSPSSDALDECKSSSGFSSGKLHFHPGQGKASSYNKPHFLVCLSLFSALCRYACLFNCLPV